MRVRRFIDEEYAGQLSRLPGTGAQAPRGPAVNICGVLVHTAPGHADEVREFLAGLPGVEIHAGNDDGRLVVTIEDTDEGLAVESLTAMSEAPGVMSTSLVYHHFDSKESMEMEEVSQ